MHACYGEQLTLRATTRTASGCASHFAQVDVGCCYCGSSSHALGGASRLGCLSRNCPSSSGNWLPEESLARGHRFLREGRDPSPVSRTWTVSGARLPCISDLFVRPIISFSRSLVCLSLYLSLSLFIFMCACV